MYRANLNYSSGNILGKTSRYLLPKQFSNIIESVVNEAVIQQCNDCLRELSSKTNKETDDSIDNLKSSSSSNTQNIDDREESKILEIKETIKYHRDVYQIEDEAIKNDKLVPFLSQALCQALKLTEKL